MKQFRMEMFETMRNAITSVINSDDKEQCLKILGEALEAFKSEYKGDKLHARLAFNSCLANALMDILSED